MTKSAESIFLLVFINLSFSVSIESCSVKNDNLLSNLDNKNIITIYTVCPHKNGERVQDHYLFKIKDDRITLTEKHGDIIKNRLSTDLKLAEDLKKLISSSTELTKKDYACEYYLKCGIQESSIYLDSESLTKFESLVRSFSNPT